MNGNVFPAIVTMIFTSVYSIVDGLFVSNFVGKTSFAALNLIFPLLMVLGALGFMIGSGGSAIIGKTLGEKKCELANQYFSMLVIVTFLCGIIFSFIGQLFIRQIAIFLGYASGSAPIISYNYGAGDETELKNVFRKSMVFHFITGVVMVAFAIAVSDPLIRLFVGYDSQLFELTLHGLKLYSASFLICGFNIFASAFFTALNNGIVSAAISFLRTLVFGSGSIIILPQILEIDGIWLAITMAEMLSIFVSAAFMVCNRKKYHYV